MLALLPIEPPEVDTLPLEWGEGRPVEGARVGLGSDRERARARDRVRVRARARVRARVRVRVRARVRARVSTWGFNGTGRTP